ncbi:hypothetical protein H7H82_14870 [Mycobacterium heidelbergense]|uniref:hypothetical protein n=1 Tax=Mycobacterium heidelbergense TaxID=53376 RepID=UPI00114D8B3E|nr:hypothetical protein [Mycobacterium heidelbergense]MCV7051857.1 hypothetical protein [Mycobacterium heidelbergense]BBZ49833.1 hypothetical protein MHEI_15500 [Mycobacterium heidelbergense]
MKFERLAWCGNLALAAIAIVLAWVPIKGDLGKWGTVGIAVVVVLAAVALFPWRRPDDSTVRMVDRFRSSVSGSGNNVQIARDHATQTMRNEGNTRNSTR